MCQSRGGKCLFYGDDPKLPHFTIHRRRDTGEIDVHLTRRVRRGEAEHTPVLRIAPEGLVRALEEVGPSLRRIILSSMRRLELDFVERRRLVVVAGLYPQGASLEELCSWRDRDTLTLDERRLAQNIRVFENPDELLVAPEGTYDLREAWGNSSRSIGFAVKVRDPAGKSHLFWVKWKRWSRAMKELEGLCAEAIGRHATHLGGMWPASVNKVSS